MGALILKSGNALDSKILPRGFAEYEARVIADGGYIANRDELKEVLNFVNSLGLSKGNLLSVVSPAWGIKVDEDGYPKKLYNLGGLDSGDIELTVTENFPDYRPKLVNIKGYAEIEIPFSAGSVKIESPDKKGFYLNNSLGVAKADREILRSDYSDSPTFCRLQVVKLRAFHDGTTPPPMAQLSWTRFGNTEADAGEFKETAYSHFGGLKAEIISKEKGVLSTSNYTLYADRDSMSFYSGGLLKATSDTQEAVEMDETIQYKAVLNGQKNSRYSSAYPITGFFAEAWVLGDINRDTMKALSLRLSRKYS